MTDTSPAAIKAWALDCMHAQRRLAEEAPAGDRQFHDARAALFRAVAALADLAAGGDAQREEDAQWVEQELPELVDMTACEAILDRLARYAREGWRAMDSAPRGGAENEPFLGCVDGVVKPLAVTGDPNVFISLLDTDQTGVGEPIYVITPRRRGRHMVVTHWRLLPAPPMENDDG